MVDLSPVRRFGGDFVAFLPWWKPINKHRFGINIRVCICMCVLALATCSSGPAKEITSTKPYADLIGSKYRIVADNVYAYGVYDALPNRTAGWVILSPIKLGGRENVLLRTIPKGQTIRILSAWQHLVLFDTGVYYLVAVENADLPPGVPIRLELILETGALVRPESARLQKAHETTDMQW